MAKKTLCERCVFVDKSTKNKDNGISLQLEVDYAKNI